MSKTQLAIVGLGGIAQVNHIPILSKMNDVEITAVCDLDLSKAKQIASKYGIKKSYKDFDKMLEENPEIAAVIITAQTDAHRELAIKSFAAGKDVLVEKPIARNYAEAEDIVEAAKKHKKKLMIGMNNRFRNDVMLMKTFVKGKEIGEPFYVKTGWIKTQSSGQKWFLEKEKAGGGVFLDNGIVMLDLGMWMLGFPEPHSVSAVNYNHNTKNVEDSNISLIKFKNGSTLSIETSWSLQREGELFYCNVFGKTGSSAINPLRIYKRMDEKLFNITPNKLQMPTNQFKKSYEFELQHFVKVINNEAEIICNGDEALSRMKIVDAIYKSASQGKEVIFK